MKFSVLMSVYKNEKAEFLDACLESLANQTLLPNEIVLVEDGPLTKELNHIIQKWQKKIQIIKSIKLEHNSGFAIALNVSADTLLGINISKEIEKVDLRITKRLKDIEKLPKRQKISLLNTIDAYLKANKPKAS